MESLLEELFQIIKRSGTPYRVVARKAGSYPSLLSDWINAKHAPSLEAFTRVANVAGYDVKLVKRNSKD